MELSSEEVDVWTKLPEEDENEPYSSEYEDETTDEGEDKAKGNYVNGYYHEIYRPDKPAKQEDVPVRDWNEEFQSILSDLSNCKGSEEEKLQLYNQLSNLAHGIVFLEPSLLFLPVSLILRFYLKDFVYVAKTYGKIIILERCLPPERKTIKPVDIGVHVPESFGQSLLMFDLILLCILSGHCWWRKIHLSRYLIQIRRG